MGSVETKSITQQYEDCMEDTGVTRLTPMAVDFKSMEAKAESQQQLEKSMVLIQDTKKKNKVTKNQENLCIREHGSVSLCRDGQKTKWRLP